jgi:hypothetical protein
VEAKWLYWRRADPNSSKPNCNAAENQPFPSPANGKLCKFLGGTKMAKYSWPLRCRKGTKNITINGKKEKRKNDPLLEVLQ